MGQGVVKNPNCIWKVTKMQIFFLTPTNFVTKPWLCRLYASHPKCS